MISKGRKMLAIGVVLGLCAVAMIGAAYAAFGGTASTYNEGNSAKTDYLQFSNAAWTAMVNQDAEFSTYTYQTGYAYYLDGAAAIGETGYVGKALMTSTKDLTLTNKTSGAVGGITFSAYTSSAIGSTDFVYILEVKVGTAAEFEAEPPTVQTKYFVFNGIATPAAQNIDLTSDIAVDGNVTVKMKLYIGYQMDVDIPASKIGAASALVPPAAPTGIGAKSSDGAPVKLNAIGFGFSATGWDPQ